MGGGPELFEVASGDGGEWVEVGEVLEGETGLGQGSSDTGFTERAGGEGVLDGWVVRALDPEAHGCLYAIGLEAAMEGEAWTVLGDRIAPKSFECLF